MNVASIFSVEERAKQKAAWKQVAAAACQNCLLLIHLEKEELPVTAEDLTGWALELVRML
jgi:hypothetical protein